jgi:hypothetical protein
LNDWIGSKCIGLLALPFALAGCGRTFWLEDRERTDASTQGDASGPSEAGTCPEDDSVESLCCRYASQPCTDAAAFYCDDPTALLVARTSSGGAALPLAGLTVSQRTIFELIPCQPVDRVVFGLDEFPDEEIDSVDASAPFHLVSGPDGAAQGLDTLWLPNGPHRMRATVETPDGPSRTAADFFVDNELRAPTLMIAPEEDRRLSTPLAGQVVSGEIFVTLAPGDVTDIVKVEMYVDGEFERNENFPPYDLAGAVPGIASDAAGFATGALAPGTRTVEARIIHSDDSSESSRAEFVVP